MEQKKYIGWGQLLLLLLMCRVFTLMTFVPFARDGDGLSLRLAAAAVSAGVQAVLLIPAVLLKRSVTETLLEKNRVCGIIAAALYLLFFLFYTANCLLHFQDFLNARFFPNADSTVWIGVLLLICVYCACLGTEALGRSAVLLFWIFAAALIAMAVTSANEADAANLYFEKFPAANLFSAVLDDLARSGEICAAAFLAGRVRDRLRCGVYGFLASKLALIEAVLLMIAAVLGDFAALTDYPFLALGTFGGAEFIQRGDALYLIVWTITAVINIALFLHISAELLGEVFPKLKFRTAISAAFVFGTLLAFGSGRTLFSGVYDLLCSGWAVILLAGAIPLIAFVLSKRKAAKPKNET